MAELLEYLVRQLVDAPDAVRVEPVERDDALVYQLYVAPDDVGKVIGRQGRIARALRTVVRAGSGASGDRRRVVLEIVE
ncbi:MAG: KH domain-containing protein [Actinomycetota bacterium]|nr:KH domain-containing protein [Thermoleophilia bacterium]MDQ3993107.1 KH domain-containing protein [Actinomycetota bacterium]